MSLFMKKRWSRNINHTIDWRNEINYLLVSTSLMKKTNLEQLKKKVKEINDIITKINNKNIETWVRISDIDRKKWILRKNVITPQE